MLTLYVLDNGKFEKIDDLSLISDFIDDKSSTVWLDALDPDAEEMNLLAEEFGFHALSIDDYFTPHDRPKIDEYLNYYFIVSHTLDYDSVRNEMKFEEFNIFLGINYIVTLHKFRMPVLERVADAWNKNPRMLENGTGLLFYDIMDGLVDSYFPILDQLEDELDEIEDMIFIGGQNRSAEQIFKLKRNLLEMRRVAAPLRDVFNSLTRRDQPLVSMQTVTYLRDVHDHILRVVDSIDTYSDISWH